MRSAQLRQGLLIGVLILFSFWLLSNIINLVDKAQVAFSEAEETRLEHETLKEREEMLQAHLATLATERGRDAAIRTTFGVARIGEEVIVVVPPPVEEATSTPTLWERILSWF
jgi:cell division protein FtsB